MSVTLSDFIPGLLGNIKDYSVQLPIGYEKYVIPSGLQKGATIWGTPEDLKAIFLDPEQYDFSLASSTVFKVSFSLNVGASMNQIVSAGIPITKEEYEKEGLENLNFKSGLFHGFEGVPALAMSGTMKDQQAYLAYLSSPVNELVIFVILQGNKSEDRDEQDWAAFINSLEIQ